MSNLIENVKLNADIQMNQLTINQRVEIIFKFDQILDD